jgi:DNA-binding protein Fis
MMLLENYFEENFKGENNYRDFSYIFEAPLLKSAQRKYKSQLQMAKYLGLNRITLRKKLDQHKELL